MAGLDHIRWIGGGTGAGKTTVARRIADQFGLSIYSTDVTIRVHASKLTAREAPLLDRFRRMSPDERWVLREPYEMYRTFPWFQGEGFDLVIDDLRALPTNRITLVEGFRLLPRLATPLLSAKTDAVWLIPTPSFRRAAFTARGQSEAFWERTTDPPRAMANLLARDQLFTENLASDASLHGLPTVTVDGGTSASALAAVVARQFAIH